MKKLLTLALMLALVISLVSCSVLPESISGQLENIMGMITGNSGDSGETPNETPDVTPDEPVHVHEFKVIKRVEPTCTEDGYERSGCDCGEGKKDVLPATGHDPVRAGGLDPTCVSGGTITYKCSVCGEMEKVKYEATGHNLIAGSEASRGTSCQNPNCPYFVVNISRDGKYSETLTFTFGDADKAALEAKHAEIAELLANAEKYDSAKHAYAEEGDLAAAYEAAYALYEEYTDLIMLARDQYSVINTLHYVDVKNKDLEATYNDMMTFYNELVSKYYELSQPWYDSMFREFFFYGATEEEIKAYLFDANALANPDYTALKTRNDEIEVEFLNVANPEYSSQVPVLYAEFVENNNKLAKLLGYENYLEYAYENVYGRDYSPADVAAFLEYVKAYIVPAFNNIYAEHKNASVDQSSINGIYACIEDSFFDKQKSNKLFNDFLDDMNMAFTTNPDKMYSFSDELNNLILDGNLFRGSYSGAYVSYLANAGIPIAYFGGGYSNIFTVSHEFGHYMNEIYNESMYDQSYDLLEIHSQGHESLLLYYLEHSGALGADVTDYVNRYQMLNNLYIIIAALQVDAFEQAIYLNSYSGYNSDIIMADGVITADEYDLLYASLSIEFGIDEAYRSDSYWRGGMTIKSPCYYVSYSVSAIGALQVYLKANNEGFEAAKESYLKLISYTDVDPDMSMEEVLEYAGFYSYMDEALYRDLARYFANR